MLRTQPPSSTIAARHQDSSLEEVLSRYQGVIQPLHHHQVGDAGTPSGISTYNANGTNGCYPDDN